MRNHISITLLEEDIAQWQYGFAILGSLIAREMQRHHMTEWPTLARAEPNPGGWAWRLLFVWPDGHGIDRDAR